MKSIRILAQEIEKMDRAEAKKEIDVVRQIITNYVDLMKSHVTVLLLGVTAAAMVIANQYLPPLVLKDYQPAP